MAARKRAGAKPRKRSRRPSTPSASPGARRGGTRGRRRYSEAERQRILETARREGLTGAQVRARFGISTLTFYTWRKKSGTQPRRGRRRQRVTSAGGSIEATIREKVRALLPQILNEEIEAALTAHLRPRKRR